MEQNIYRKSPALIALLLAVSLFPALLQPATAQAADQSDNQTAVQTTVQTETQTQAAVQVLPGKVVLENFPIFAQQHYLSCEYSATRMATAFWNQEIGEQEFIDSIPLSENPHLGYRGNIDAAFGGTWNYGIYLEPIARYLETRGFSTKLLAGGEADLKAELAKGRPVQVITIAGMGWANPYTTETDGLSYQLAAGEHSVVIYGYDAGGVYVADPGYGTQDYYSWSSFLRSWAYLGNMGMSVWKQDTNLASVSESAPGISNYFYRQWLNNGGLTLYGKPISAPETKGATVYQYFERARLEYNLDGPATQPIMAGLVGRELAANRFEEAPFQRAAQAGDPNTLYFEATGHNLSLGFKDFWLKNGGLAVFGYPLSEEYSENGRTIQYFERARFEYFPDNPEPTKVQLGLVGVERFKATLPV